LDQKNTTKKNYRSFLTFFIILAALILIVYLSFSGSTGEEIKIGQFETIVEEGKVEEVYIVGYTSGGTVKVKLSDGSSVSDSAWPSSSDYYFSYISYDRVIGVVDGYNTKIAIANSTDPELAELTAEYATYKDRAVVTSVEGNPSASFIETVLPYLSLLIFVVIAFLIVKALTAKNGSAVSFGRSKVKVASKSQVRFTDIAGMDEEKEEVSEIVEFLKNPLRFKALGVKIPKGVLLVGAPGTGKTLLAKAVAGESNVPFFSISGSDFVELYVGVGASRVRDLFETAKKNAPCIIFIDEIDAVGRQRGAGLGGGSDEREQTLNQLLVEMDGFDSNEGIIVMAATNRADILDPALLRSGRFNRQIYVNIPDVRGREGILKIHAKGKPLDEDIDFKAIARLTSGFTGADIENFLNEAAIIAARNGRVSISMEDISEGINKVIMGPQKKSRVVSENDKKISAYHEAGHAIVTKILNFGETVHEVSIIPRGNALGYTSIRPSDDEEGMSYDKLRKRICTFMGGRVAEELKFKDITAGASSDINKATDIARRMITEWGMSKKLGFISLGKNKEVFIGRNYQVQNTYSETTAAIIDKEMKTLLDNCYVETKKILTERLDTLENMAMLLLDKETIYGDEIEAIMKGTSWKRVSVSLDKKEKKRKEIQDKKKKEQEQNQALQVQKMKEQAAEALASAGVLSPQELEVIKQDGEKLRKQLVNEQEKTTNGNTSATMSEKNAIARSKADTTTTKKPSKSANKKEEGKPTAKKDSSTKTVSSEASKKEGNKISTAKTAVNKSSSAKSVTKKRAAKKTSSVKPSVKKPTTRTTAEKTAAKKTGTTKTTAKKPVTKKTTRPAVTSQLTNKVANTKPTDRDSEKK